MPARHALAGGILAALVFEVMKSVFASYIRAVPTYRLVYGAFAAIPIFLLWLYLSWLVVLLGAEFTASLAYWKGRLWRREESPEALPARGVRARARAGLRPAPSRCRSSGFASPSTCRTTSSRTCCATSRRRAPCAARARAGRSPARGNDAPS